MSLPKDSDIPEFKSFVWPLIRKPAKKLISADLVGTPEESAKNIADLFDGVAKHMAEVVEALKDCKCPKCVPEDKDGSD